MSVRIQFHALAAGGDAVGRDETGRAVFVPYAAPGDVAQVEIVQDKGSWARGRLLHLEAASPQRTIPPCPYFLPPDNDPRHACGGCQIQHLQYPAQLDAKRQIVADALARLGGVENPNVAPCVASPQEFDYRNKADFEVRWSDDAPIIGFNARGTHNVLDIAHCPIQHPANNALLDACRQFLSGGLVTGLVMRTSSNGEQLLLIRAARPWPGAEAFARRMMQEAPALRGVLLQVGRGEGHVVAARGWLEETVCGLNLRVSGAGFFQVNTLMVPLLVETTLAAANIGENTRTLDLFCGVGLFALAMARQGARVLGVEANPQAVRDAQGNAKRNALKAEFRAGDATRILNTLRDEAFDVLLLDPPREGASDVAKLLASRDWKGRPTRVVYVSCDPATLARDVKILRGGGYVLQQAAPLDLFPQTSHVETVAALTLEA